MKWLFFVFFIGLSNVFPMRGLKIQYGPGKTYIYDFESTTILNQSDIEPQAEKNVGIRVKASVYITVLWKKEHDALVKLEVKNFKVSGAFDRDKNQDAFGHTAQIIKTSEPIYFHWSKGQIIQVFSIERAKDSVVLLNQKKAIVSLFQLQADPGERSEVDVSGICTASYQLTETMTVKKTKNFCQPYDYPGELSHAMSILGSDVQSVAVAEYEINTDNIIQSVLSTEINVFAPRMRRSLATQITVRQTLNLDKTTDGSSRVDANDIEGAVAKVGKLMPHSLQLGLLPPKRKKVSKVIDNLQEHKLNLQTPASSVSGKVFLKLLSYFRSPETTKKAVLKILRCEENKNILLELIDVITAAQTDACQEALMEFLQFGKGRDRLLAEKYLLAASFSSHPSDKLLSDLWQLFNREDIDMEVKESILLTIGSLMNKYLQDPERQKSNVYITVKASLLENLESCETDINCRVMYLRAFRNFGLPENVDLFLRLHTKEANLSNAVVVESLKALQKLDRDLICTDEMKKVSWDVYNQFYRGYDDKIRTLVADILLDCDPSFELLSTFITTNYSTMEVTSYIYEKIKDLARRNEEIRIILKDMYKTREIGNWHMAARHGKSTFYQSVLAETNDIQADYTINVLFTKSGLLRASSMNVAVAQDDDVMNIVTVGIFAKGLESIVGTVEGEEAEETASAGMQLTMFGTDFRPIVFFDGKTQLMSAIWSGKGSNPTSAVTANLLLQDHFEFFPLSSGWVAELKLTGVISVDLKGSVQVSLWYQTSNSLVQCSGGMVISGSAKLQHPDASVGMSISASTEADINFATDVNFGTKPLKICMQMIQPNFVYRHKVRTFEKPAVGRHKGFTSSKARRRHISGKSFLLHQKISQLCSLMEAEKY